MFVHHGMVHQSWRSRQACLGILYKTPMMPRNCTILEPAEAFKPCVYYLAYFMKFASNMPCPMTKIYICQVTRTKLCVQCFWGVKWWFAVSISETTSHHLTHVLDHMAIVTPLSKFFSINFCRAL